MNLPMQALLQPLHHARTHTHTHIADLYETVNIQQKKNDHSAHARLHAHTHTPASAVSRLMNANDLKIHRRARFAFVLADLRACTRTLITARKREERCVMEQQQQQKIDTIKVEVL